MCIQKTQVHSNLKERCVSLKLAGGSKISSLAALWGLNLSFGHFFSSHTCSPRAQDECSAQCLSSLVSLFWKGADTCFLLH